MDTVSQATAEGLVRPNVDAERRRATGALSARATCYAATSSNALGFLSAIISSVLAGPEGARLPCSHS